MRPLKVKAGVFLLAVVLGLGAYLFWRGVPPARLQKPKDRQVELAGVLLPSITRNYFALDGEVPEVTSSTNYMVLVPRMPERLANLPVSEGWVDEAIVEHDCGTLIVKADRERKLWINDSVEVGTVNNTSELRAELEELFDQRISNRAFKRGMEYQDDLPMQQRIPATVILQFSCALTYGEVLTITDAVKAAGANQIALQVGECNP